MAHPDATILSAFVDGEVPEPWTGAVASHVEACAECRAVVGRLRSTRDLLAAAPEPDPAAARDAVWLRLASTATRRKRPVWSLRLAVPLPVALAAALLVAAFGTLAFGAWRENGRLRLAAYEPQELQPAFAQNVGFDSILRYLESQDASLSITIQLPPSAGSGAVAGKPVMMKSSPGEDLP